MVEKFDPYHTWLAIPPEEQPPTLYRLLGLRPFEDNSDVIESAADRQTIYLRDFRSGKHGAESQELLDEVAAAKLTLLNEKSKADYDKTLRESRDQQVQEAEPGEELSESLVGFLEHLEAEREKQAPGKKARETAKPAKPRKRATKQKPPGQSEPPPQTAVGRDRRDTPPQNTGQRRSDRSHWKTVSYDRDFKTPRRLSYNEKFADFFQLCNEARNTGCKVLLIHAPEVLGDTYQELVSNLYHCAWAGLVVQIVQRKEDQTIEIRVNE